MLLNMFTHLAATAATTNSGKHSSESAYRHHIYVVSVFVYGVFLIHSNNGEVVAIELVCALRKAVDLPFHSAFRR